MPLFVLPTLLFALISAHPWVGKNISPPRFVEGSEEKLAASAASVTGSPRREEIDTFLSQPGASIQVGRVLYPRFFGKEGGLASANPWPAYAFRDYPRIGFLLLNDGSHYVVFPTKRLPEFPHARDAIILGCQAEAYLEARWVVFPELDSVYSTEAPAGSCSL
jgi:hypothetical protein